MTRPAQAKGDDARAVAAEDELHRVGDGGDAEQRHLEEGQLDREGRRLHEDAGDLSDDASCARRVMNDAPRPNEVELPVIEG